MATNGAEKTSVASEVKVAPEIPKKMKAATVVEFNKPLELLDVDVPEPTGSTILVKINASSLCMSDIHGHAGGLGMPTPYCAGHEPVGVVVAVPASSTGFAIGERVGFMPAARTCQACHSCLMGNHRFCKKRINIGFSQPYGGFSEYTLADTLSTVKIPEGISDEEAAPMLCAGVTAYAAVKKIGQKQPGGTLISIVGCGGVGHIAIQYAKKMGYDVQAFDVAQDKLDLALHCGADIALDSTKEADLAKMEQTPTTIVISGAGAAYDFAFKVTRIHGRIICVGVPHKPISVSMMDVVLKDISLIATNQGTKEELNEALKLAAAKGIKPVIERRHISQINEGIDDIKSGRVNGRLVYHF